MAADANHGGLVCGSGCRSAGQDLPVGRDLRFWSRSLLLARRRVPVVELVGRYARIEENITIAFRSRSRPSRHNNRNDGIPVARSPIWDAARGRPGAGWAYPCTVNYNDIDIDSAFSPDGRTFAAVWVAKHPPGNETLSIDLIDVASGRSRASIPRSAAVYRRRRSCSCQLSPPTGSESVSSPGPAVAAKSSTAMCPPDAWSRANPSHWM